VVDILALGFEDGHIILLNILYNEELLSFTHSSNPGPICSLSFSSDLNLGISLLGSVSSSEEGENITFWDLNKKKIHCTLPGAHDGKQVSCIKFMDNEPAIITSSADGNSIKMWLFEKGLTVPRLLRQRCGHASPPIRIRFYGGQDDPIMNGARNLLSCSEDGCLRDISLLNEF